MDAVAATRAPGEREQRSAEPASLHPSRLRTGVVGVLLALGLLATLLAPVAVWTRALVFDTDRYTATLAPVARDAGVQRAVVAAVERQVTEHVDIAGFVRTRLPAAARALGALVRTAMVSFVHGVITRIVRSPAFAAVWDSLNRATHATLVRALRGEPLVPGRIIAFRDGTLVLDLGPVLRAVRSRLLKVGLVFAAAVPPTGAVIALADTSTLTRAGGAARTLDALGFWLPPVALGLLAAAVAVARRRRRTATAAALGVAGAMVVLSVALAVARHVVVDALPASVLDREAAVRVFDAVVAALRAGIVTLLVVALLVAAGVWFSGSQARSLRRRLAAGWHARVRLEPAGLGAGERR